MNLKLKFISIAVLVITSCNKVSDELEESILTPSKETCVIPTFTGNDDDDFMIAVIGDTQYYTQNSGTNDQYMYHFEAKVNWVKNNRLDSNIVYVASVGDITENYDHSNSATEQQWILASRIYSKLENITGLADGIPYGVVPGDHDIAYSSPWEVSRYYEQYFGVSRFGDRAYYQGDFPEGENSNVNHYDFISSGGVDLMVVYLRWHDNSIDAKEAYEWAYEKIAENPTRKAIVVTHYAVAARDEDYDGKLDWGLQSRTPAYSQAESIYNKLKSLPNFFMMLGGHVKHEGRRQDTYNGKTVKSFTSNYQGNIYPPGLLRIMKFSPGNDRIQFMTFIPGEPHLTSERSTFYRPWVHSFTTTRTCDFNNNGKSEPSFFNDGVWSLYGLPECNYGAENNDIPVPGDYDGDGKTDIAILREGSSNNTWLRPDQSSVKFGQPGDIPAPGDYDGNGTTDYAFFRPSEGIWYVRQEYLPSPHSVTKVYGEEGDIPVPADYNGDGKVNYALFRPSTAEWLRFGIDENQFGEPGDIPVPGDYNGDGIVERAVYRPDNNGWYVDGMGNLFNIGQAGDIPVPGDYNGDGKTDIAVYRPTDGKVYISDGISISTGNIDASPVNLPYAIRNYFFP